MSKKWPSAAVVEDNIERRGFNGEIRTELLRQFAALLRQMEAHGSPRTDAAEILDYSDGMIRGSGLVPKSLCAHFESALGAVEAMTVERLAKECEEDAENYPGVDSAHTVLKDTARRFRTYITSTRAGGSTERRIRGERREQYTVRFPDPRSGKDRRNGERRVYQFRNVPGKRLLIQRSGNDRRQP